jgi:hypothetical protein
MSEHSPKSNTTPLIKPSSKSNSTTLPKHKNALPRVTNPKQEQKIDIDPNTILRNSLITTNYYFDFKKNLEPQRKIKNARDTLKLAAV